MEIPILIVAGFVSGFMNTVASSGSAITLPLMVFLGLPPGTANATNRIPLLLGFITATIQFVKAGTIPRTFTGKLILPVLAGTLTGCLLVNRMSDFQFKILLAFALVMCMVLILGGAARFLREKAVYSPKPLGWLGLLVGYGLGIWGGLIVLDIGTLMLFFLVLLQGLDLRSANSVKAVLMLVISSASALYFGLESKIDWMYALLLSAGSMVGSYTGAAITVRRSVGKVIYGILVTTIGVELLLTVYRLSGG